MRERKRRKTIVLVCFIAMAVVATISLLWLRVSIGSRATNNPIPAASASATPHKEVMLEANVHLLEGAFNDPDIKKQAQALVIELRNDFLAQGQSMLPPGRTLKLRQDTFLVYGDNTSGQIEATISSGEMFVLHLFRENGTWLVLYTEEK